MARALRYRSVKDRVGIMGSCARSGTPGRSPAAERKLWPHHQTGIWPKINARFRNAQAFRAVKRAPKAPPAAHVPTTSAPRNPRPNSSAINMNMGS